MILCDGNYGLGAYGMDSVHNREPEQSQVTIYYVVPNSCAVRNNSVGWKIHPN